MSKTVEIKNNDRHPRELFHHDRIEDSECQSPFPENDSPGSEQPSAMRTLPALFRAHRLRLLFTYGLFTIENALRLAEPTVLGMAINDWLRSSASGLGLFLVIAISRIAVRVVRDMFDTRCFTAIYSDLATRLVTIQRRRNVEVSCVAARTALSREIVSFFEYDIPLIAASLYSAVGALGALALQDWLLATVCASLLLPHSVFNVVYAKRTYGLNTRLHDAMENEVKVISGGEFRQLRDHFNGLAQWWIKLSDWSAANSAIAQVAVVVLISITLVRSCANGATPGHIYATISYVVMFTTALHCAPVVVEQIGRLRDICLRLRMMR